MNKQKNRQKSDEQSNLMMDNFIEKLNEQKKDISCINMDGWMDWLRQAMSL